MKVPEILVELPKMPNGNFSLLLGRQRRGVDPTNKNLWWKKHPS
jgi:hypothetical protein